jgi:hypothetical protein
MYALGFYFAYRSYASFKFEFETKGVEIVTRFKA